MKPPNNDILIFTINPCCKPVNIRSGAWPLIFKILNSGNFLTNLDSLSNTDYLKLTNKISNKALRYARNQNSPFQDEQDDNAILEPIVFEEDPISLGARERKTSIIWLGNSDIKLGEIGGVPFYMNGDQYEKWKHTDLTIDAVKGIGGMFSLDNGTGRRFLTKSEICLVVDNDNPNH